MNKNQKNNKKKKKKKKNLKTIIKLFLFRPRLSWVGLFCYTLAFFIYILDSSFPSPSKFWSSKFPSSSFSSLKMIECYRFEITFHCIAKEMGAKAFLNNKPYQNFLKY